VHNIPIPTANIETDEAITRVEEHDANEDNVLEDITGMGLYIEPIQQMNSK